MLGVSEPDGSVQLLPAGRRRTDSFPVGDAYQPFAESAGLGAAGRADVTGDGIAGPDRSRPGRGPGRVRVIDGETGG